MEPLAVALAGIERAGIRLGDPIAIWSVLSCGGTHACLVADALQWRWSNRSSLPSGRSRCGLCSYCHNRYSDHPTGICPKPRSKCEDLRDSTGMEP